MDKLASKAALAKATANADEAAMNAAKKTSDAAAKASGDANTAMDKSKEAAIAAH